MSSVNIPLGANTQRGKISSLSQAVEVPLTYHHCWGKWVITKWCLTFLPCHVPFLQFFTVRPWQPGGTAAAQHIEHTVAVDSSVTLCLLPSKSKDFRTDFCHPWQRKHAQAMGVYLCNGEHRRKRLCFPLQPLFSALWAFLVGRVCPVATSMARHSGFWCPEHKIMTILNLYFSE